MLLFTCVSYAEARNRLDVRPSVTRWYCIKTAERIVMMSSPHDSPFILVLCVYQDLREIPTGSPPAGPLNRGGVWKYRNFRPITCYISETVEDCPRGVPRGGQNVQKCAEIANFGFYGLNYGKTVEDRCIHAAMRLTSIDSLLIHVTLPRWSQGRRPSWRMFSWRYSHPSCYIK